MNDLCLINSDFVPQCPAQGCAQALTLDRFDAIFGFDQLDLSPMAYNVIMSLLREMSLDTGEILTLRRRCWFALNLL